MSAAGRVPWLWVVTAGAAIGFAYTLSPLTVVVCAGLVPLWRWASAGLTPQERRWVLGLFAIALALRAAAIAGLFLTADPTVPYANFFGDEEFFKRKTTWLRNVAMGIPISKADFLYAYDETGFSSYLYVLSYLQALVGLAPYGIHVLNAGAYLAAVLVLFRIMRKAFGELVGLFGTAVLLFLPSLFIWSISALKEPLYFLVVSVNLGAAMTMVRGRPWTWRLVAFLTMIAGGFALQTLREGGLVLAFAGAGGGLALAFLVQRPRLLLTACAAVPLVALLAFTRPVVQERAWDAVHQVALKHWGYINTPGVTYKLMPPEFYVDRQAIQAMTPAQATQYSLRAVWAYLTVPLPWAIESRSALAFLPEQIIWYCLFLLLPFGVLAGLKRDVLLTCMLISHGIVSAGMVAVSGGNVGTLVRHRGLALPYLVWFGGLGAVSLALWILSSARSRQFEHLATLDESDGASHATS